jgi:hypothetical protein
MTLIIRNPAGGDCGFYSFAIGLIHIIQKEYRAEGISNTFALWQEKGLSERLETINTIDLQKLARAPHSYKFEVLSQLQMSLRVIASKSFAEDLIIRLKQELVSEQEQTIAEGSTAYGKFMELVHFYLKKNPKKWYLKVFSLNKEPKTTLEEISHFNELALCPKVLELAERTAQTLEKKIQNSSFAQKQKLENAFVKQVILNDVLQGEKANPNSTILKALEPAQGRWATELDLNEIAIQLKVNLHINGHMTGQPNPSYQTITLQNEHNEHWVTVINDVPCSNSYESEEERFLSFEEDSEEEEKLLSLKPKAPDTLSEHRFSEKEQQIIEATISTQAKQHKIVDYKQNIELLISHLGLFANVQNKITNLDAIDQEQPITAKESDESYSTRIQEAELRRVQLL